MRRAILSIALVGLIAGCATTGSLPAEDTEDQTTTSAQNGQPAAYADTVRPTWQTNGRVESIVFSDEVVYLAGQFTAIAPPGSDEWVTQLHVAAFDVESGEPLPWDPEVNGRVRGLDLAPDGETLFLVGEFTQVGGQQRSAVAAVDAATGTLRDDFRPDVAGKVRSVLTSSDRVYIGGTFNEVNGEQRSLIAALEPSTGEPVPGWAPLIEYPTHPEIANVITMSLSGETLYVGGTFRTVDGQSRNAAAALAVADGSLESWNPRLLSRAEDLETQVYDIAIDGEHVYLCGDYHLTDGVFTPNLVAVDSEGLRREEWEVTTDGGVNSCDIAGGHIYLGGHFELVGGPNADPKINPTPTGEERKHLASVNLATGEVTGWDPRANSIPGVYAVAAGDFGLAIGGDFDEVGTDHASHRGFAVFPSTET